MDDLVKGNDHVRANREVHENVMFPPAAVRPSERLKAGPGKPGHWGTPRVTGGSLFEHSRPQVFRKRASTRTSGVLRGHAQVQTVVRSGATTVSVAAAGAIKSDSRMAASKSSLNSRRSSTKLSSQSRTLLKSAGDRLRNSAWICSTLLMEGG